MQSVRSPLVQVPTKAPTGIAGFDEITGGGLPRGHTTLQFLVHGAQECKEPGISGASSASDRQPK